MLHTINMLYYCDMRLVLLFLQNENFLTKPMIFQELTVKLHKQNSMQFNYDDDDGTQLVQIEMRLNLCNALCI